ncbi:MAG TPA: TonB-dependent receptor [Vicinamibacterales bacterium]
MTIRPLSSSVRIISAFILLLAPSAARGQTPAATFQLPLVIVTAQKEATQAQELPVSLTAFPEQTVRDSGAIVVSDLAAPNIYFTEFTARKLSNPRFRGIGASPANPAVTTYYDGVPQLNANTSSIDLLEVGQVEYVRGPQSTLFGRNAIGGLINVTSVRPSLSGWTGRLSVPFANFSSRDVRGSVAGPVIDGKLAVSGAIQYGQRDGFTVNDLNGNDVDSREGFSAKGQMLWTPNRSWETRVIVNGERNRDGDYALSDLGGLRANPYHVMHDFEGYTNRDIFATTILNRHESTRFSVTSTTGFLKWKTEDATDLDYTPLPLIVRNNNEESFQFTQEVRLASAPNAAIRVSDGAALKWQAGVFLFTQNYEQNAVNTLAPFTFSPFISFPLSLTLPDAELDDFGIGVYGQGTTTIGNRFDLTAGVRVDNEQKDALISTFFTPQIAPRRDLDTDESFSNVSPSFSAAVRIQPEKTAYLSVTRGYKAGGFNPVSPIGSEAYGEEHAWNFEGGVKTLWSSGRVMANASVFRINWDDLQLNVPDLTSPAQFYIANIGDATSTGVEAELNARVHPSVDVFGGVGYTRARFSDGSVSNGVPVGGNTIPNTPEYTVTLGTQVTHPVRPGISVYGRAEAVFYGAFEYDDMNLARQDAYSLANFRAGARGRYLFAEAWVRNAFDTKYIPLAFAYGQLAPSGFIGEMGRPRTFGVSAGVGF